MVGKVKLGEIKILNIKEAQAEVGELTTRLSKSIDSLNCLLDIASLQGWLTTQELNDINKSIADMREARSILNTKGAQ